MHTYDNVVLTFLHPAPPSIARTSSAVWQCTTPPSPTAVLAAPMPWSHGQPTLLFQTDTTPSSMGSWITMVAVAVAATTTTMGTPAASSFLHWRTTTARPWASVNACRQVRYTQYTGEDRPMLSHAGDDYDWKHLTCKTENFQCQALLL